MYSKVYIPIVFCKKPKNVKVKNSKVEKYQVGVMILHNKFTRSKDEKYIKRNKLETKQLKKKGLQ